MVEVAETAEEWRGYDYPGSAESFGEEYMNPCPSRHADAEMDKEERRRRAMKRILLRSNTDIWEQCCEEVAIERMELDHVLLSLGLPDSGYSKDKSFPERTFREQPDLSTCTARDYLEFYVFPYLLPAIEELIKFARKNNVLQCRLCTFAPADFLSEFLYNNNPLHPDRRVNPVPLFDTEMAKRFLQQNPRPPLPKWLKMSKDEAAVVIQRAFRGFLVRRLEHVQELRQFWRDYKKDMEEVQCDSPATEDFKNLLASFAEEDELVPVQVPEVTAMAPAKTHSQECTACAAFRKYIIRNRGRRRNRSRTVISVSARQRDSEKTRFCYQDANQITFTALPMTLTKKWHPSVSCLTKVKCPLERRDSDMHVDSACDEFKVTTSTGTIHSLLDLPFKAGAKPLRSVQNSQSETTDSNQTNWRKSIKLDKSRVRLHETKSKGERRRK